MAASCPSPCFFLWCHGSWRAWLRAGSALGACRGPAPWGAHRAFVEQEMGCTRCVDGGKSHRGRGTTMLGRSWRMDLSVLRLLGFLRLPSHLWVNERQPVASGRHSHRRWSHYQREGGWASGKAVTFGAAGQSAQISLICVTQMNKIQKQQLETIQWESLSKCKEVCWSCMRPCLGYMSSISDTTATLVCSLQVYPHVTTTCFLAHHGSESCSPNSPSCPPWDLMYFMVLLFMLFIQPGEQISLSEQGRRLPSHYLLQTHVQSSSC